MSFTNARRSAVPFLILAAASWGLGVVISKRAVAEIPPLTLLPIQLAASLVALAVWMRIRGIPLRDHAAAPILGRLGLLNPGLAYALSLLGLASITASVSVMLWATEPLLIALLAGLALGERIGRSLIALSLLAIAGMALVVDVPGSGGDLTGVVLTLAGVGCCAIYTVVARRWLGASQAAAPVVVSQQAYALGFALVLVAGVWVAGGAVWPDRVSLGGWLSAIGSGVLYYGTAFWLYLTALRSMPASQAAAAFYLIPLFGIAGGAILLGERLDGSQWIGVVIVLASVLLILRSTQASDVDARTAIP